MSKQHEKAMIDFQRLLSTKDFKTEKELRDFMNSLIGTELPSFPEETLTNEEKAIDLVLSAYDCDPKTGFERVMEALELDCDCIDAYEFLGNINDFPPISDAFMRKEFRLDGKNLELNFLGRSKDIFGFCMRQDRLCDICIYTQTVCMN